MQPALETLKKIEYEYSLRDELDSAWAVRSLAVSEQRGLTMLVLEDPGGETLDRLLPGPMGITQFLRLAVSVAKALDELHKRGLIHQDVKPSNFLVNPETCQVWLMGLGIASRLPRERQAPELPEFIAGRLHYMAPEQTGRMDRSIDSRSDLYSLGVTLYEMLTGALPFTASEPMELVHCHIARQATPPRLRFESIPDAVSAIVMKLLAKTPEERYQTAVGVERDLRRCLSEWETQHRIVEFPLGEQDKPVASSTSIIATPVEPLDLATVINVSQAISGEMVLEKLIARLMRVAIEHAGAERGLLIVPQGDELQTTAEAAMSGEDVSVRFGDGSHTAPALPESLVRYVMRTQEVVNLADASVRSPFSADPYIVQCRAKSILCLPLINQTKLIGILYLENNLTPHVFTPDRVTVLKVLASQAAISLQNSRLYRDLEDREGKIRRLVDANILGIFIWNLEGAILDANEAFLGMLQYGREDLLSGRLRWTDLRPDEWRQRGERALAEVRATGTTQPFEREFFRKDGSRVPVLMGGALFQGGGNEGVAFVLDLSEQKRAEEKIREHETELRQILDLTPQLVSVFGPSLERIYANRVALDYLGISLDEWRLGLRGSLIHPDDFGRYQAEAERSVATGAAYELELRLRKNDGSYPWFLARFNPVRDDKGHVSRWYVACTDIDDRKRTEERLQLENATLRDEIDRASMFEEIIGTSKPLKTVLARIAKVAPTDSSVLITGETGTGKELIARAVHKRSQRSGRAFVSVNCAALAPSLIPSELFGHEKGAFTGAMQRRLGRFELADGGTIFLDEVGELPSETQVALLRVLQERKFERVGGTQLIQVDVRVIAATNRDLSAAISHGTFRADLFYRLNVFPIEIPPLRERREDIMMLVEYFVKRYANQAGKNIRSIDKKTLALFEQYDWPGNIRELQNVVERSIILTSGNVLSVDESWLSKEPPKPPNAIQAASLQMSHPAGDAELEEREIIEAALASSRGRVAGPTGAAAKLQVPPSTLEYKIKALKIRKSRFKFG